MRILFILPHPIEGPSSRFRVYQYIPHLEEQGITCDVRPFVSSKHVHELYKNGNILRKIFLTLYGLIGRIWDIVRAPKYDVVFVLREAFALGPPFIEKALRRRSKCFVFDFDDAIYIPSFAYQNAIDKLRDFGKPARIISWSDTVIAGSQYLADYAAKTATGRVVVLPTVVDAQVYQPRPKNGNTLTLGWIGTPRGSHYVADMMPVFKDLHARHTNIRFVFVGCSEFDTQGLPIELREWSLDREPQDVAEFDIGIMPLTDDEETRGKCGFKLIQYMSSGVAAVGSPVGVNNEIIENGHSGLLAANAQEWFAALDKLISDHAYRKKIAENGRTRAKAHYSLQATAPQMIEILQETIVRRGQ